MKQIRKQENHAMRKQENKKMRKQVGEKKIENKKRRIHGFTKIRKPAMISRDWRQAGIPASRRKKL